MKKLQIISSLLILMLVLVACGGEEATGNEGDTATNNGDGGQADLSIENLDQQLVLDNTGTLAEEETFENFVINYPSNWHGSQDGFEMTVSNSQDVVNSHGAILAGTQDIPEGAILIQAQSQATVNYSGAPVASATTADEFLKSYLTAFGQTAEPVPYEEIDLPAYRHVSVDGVEQFFPAGTVLVTVEYAEGMALYQVIFDGSIEEFEPIAREIINNATIDG